MALIWLQVPDYCPLIGHNLGLLLARSLDVTPYIMGLNNNPTCRKSGTEEGSSVHILCECKFLASLRYTYLGSFFGPGGS